MAISVNVKSRQHAGTTVVAAAWRCRWLQLQAAIGSAVHAAINAEAFVQADGARGAGVHSCLQKLMVM